MPPTFREDPYAGYNFQLVINGVADDPNAVQAAFTEVSGLEVEVDVIEYRSGAEDITVRKLPGLKKYANLVLKRGVTGHPGFWDWINQVLKGQAQRADGSIILLDESKQEVMRWNFRRGWPCKWTGPSLNATTSEVAIETLEICHEGLELDT